MCVHQSDWNGLGDEGFGFILCIKKIYMIGLNARAKYMFMYEHKMHWQFSMTKLGNHSHLAIESHTIAPRNGNKGEIKVLLQQSSSHHP